MHTFTGTYGRDELLAFTGRALRCEVSACFGRGEKKIYVGMLWGDHQPETLSLHHSKVPVRWSWIAQALVDKRLDIRIRFLLRYHRLGLGISAKMQAVLDAHPTPTLRSHDAIPHPCQLCCVLKLATHQPNINLPVREDLT